MEQDDQERSPKRKRRTREHVIEDLSENHLEKMVLLRGHILRRPARDYGVDVTMFHFARDGQIENGEVRFQLKATDSMNLVDNGTVVSVPIETRDIEYWSKGVYPFILIIFDARAERAFWLDVKEYVRVNPEATYADKRTTNIRIPVRNALTVQAIDDFRRKSLETIGWIRQQGGFPDAPKKPR